MESEESKNTYQGCDIPTIFLGFPPRGLTLQLLHIS